MHVIVAHTAFSDTDALEQIVESLGCQRQEDSVLEQAAGGKSSGLKKVLGKMPSPALIPADRAGGLDALGDWLGASDTTHLLAFHTPPETAIARAIATEGETLEDAIEKWTESARSLLGTIRHNRKRTTLFDADAAGAGTDAYIRTLTDHLGLKASRATTPETDAAESTPNELHRVIAAQAVAQSPDLQDLRDELEASAIPLATGDVTPVPDCQQALARLQEREEKYQQTSEENELLLLQLHQVQEELESYYLEARDKEQERKRLSDENAKLTDQIAKLTDENAKLKNERDRARQSIANIKNSSSWKLTAPLRAIRGKGRTDKPSAEA